MWTFLFCSLLALLFVCEEATSFSVVAPSAATTTTKEASAELLELLQKKSNDRERVDSLVRQLVRARVSFDPKECIDGPFYSTCHFIGETPLWERIGSLATDSNVKGQKYSFRSDGGDDDDGTITGTFINYSEILGESLHLRAQGTFADSGSSPSSLSSSTESAEKADGGGKNLLQRLFGKGKEGDDSSSSTSSTASASDLLLRTCPYDYIATVTRASFHLFGAVLPVDIEGTGCVRVLYADPYLRIFVSPNDTNVTSGGGDWEKAGLTVVQVRQDLILGDDEDTWKLVNET